MLSSGAGAWSDGKLAVVVIVGVRGARARFVVKQLRASQKGRIVTWTANRSSLVDLSPDIERVACRGEMSICM